jgi:hypothetical protein
VISLYFCYLRRFLVIHGLHAAGRGRALAR